MKKGFFGAAPKNAGGESASAKKPDPPVVKQMVDRGGDEEKVNAPRVDFAATDFYIFNTLGEGSFSKVKKAKRKNTEEWYALKVMDKRFLIRNKKVDLVMRERGVMDKLSYPGVCRLHFTFQDTASLYMGLELCTKGELFTQIKRKEKLPEEEARFYTGEIVLILEYMHAQGVVHRDLKPENLLLSEDGHLKLCDFGSARDFGKEGSSLVDTGEDGRKSTFVGTAEYMAPEVLHPKQEDGTYIPFTKSADFWALGCCLYQMVVGTPPFRGDTEYLTMELVSNLNYKPIPDTVTDPCKDLILQLLVKDPRERLGHGQGGHTKLKSHPFLADLNFDNLRDQTPPVYAPHPNAEPEEQQPSESSAKSGLEKLTEDFNQAELLGNYSTQAL